MKKILSRFRLGVPALVIVLGIMLLPDTAWAAQGSDTLKAMAEIAGVVIEILTFLALLMLKFFGELLGTDMITGPEAMAAIRPMWVWVRNLTNILFVGVLLFLAFSNLFSSFGGDGGNWTIKEKLPKLIIAMIAINFSLLGFKLVIDAVNVGTIAILGIADHKLDPDTRDFSSGMASEERTWMKVDEARYDLILEQSEKKELWAGDPMTGDNCNSAWMAKFGKESNIVECANKPESCILHAKSAGGDSFVCRGFAEQINDLFCSKWIKNSPEDTRKDDKCVFMVDPGKFGNILKPSEEPGQNLFAAFGSTFMHLERLPALGAEIKDLGAVVTNTLFSAILALAFIVALIAVFIAMIARVIVLWVAMVFSPLLIGYAIIEPGQGGDISNKIITHLIMPLKVAAAFAVGFVMMSAMVEWHGFSAGDGTFVFGPALAQLGKDEYGFLWQIATIVLFWAAAFWALEGNAAAFITDKIKSGAETLGEVAAKSATIDRPMFATKVDGQDKKFSMGALLDMPRAIEASARAEKNESFEAMTQAFNLSASPLEQKIKNKQFDGTAKDMKNLMVSMGSFKAILDKKDLIQDQMRLSGKFSSEQMTAFSKITTKDDINKFLTASMRGGSDITIKQHEFAAAKSTDTDNDKSKATTESKVKVEDKGTSGVAVGDNTIKKGESTKETQKVVEKALPNDNSELTKSQIEPIVKNADIDKKTEGGMALPVSKDKSNALRVEVFTSEGERLNWSKIGASATGDKGVEALNTMNSTTNVNMKEVYQNSTTDVQNQIKNEIKQTAGNENIDWDEVQKKFVRVDEVSQNDVEIPNIDNNLPGDIGNGSQGNEEVTG